MNKAKLLFDEIRMQIRLSELYKKVDSDKLVIYLCHINNLSTNKEYQDYQPGNNHLIAEFIGMYYLFHPRVIKSIESYKDFLSNADEFQRLAEKLIMVKRILMMK